MKLIQNYINKILSLGITDNFTKREIIRIRIINICAILVLSTSIIDLPLFIQSQRWSYVIFDSVFMILFISILWLNANQKLKISLHLFNIAIPILFLFVANLSPKDDNFYYLFMFPLFATTFLFFERRKIINIYTIYYIITTGLIIMSPFSVFDINTFDFTLFWIILSAFFFLGITLNFILQVIIGFYYELKTKTEELERSNRELEQFAYIASHDLQEPLRTISNFTTILEEDLEDRIQEEEREYMRLITDGTDRMQSLIDSLLEYSRVDKVTQFSTIDIKALIHNKTLDLALKIEETNTNIDVGTMPDNIIGEPNQLSIVFYNLINNGIKFNKTVHPTITITYVEKPTHHQFCIADNGIGIAPKNKERIFEIFTRLHRKEEYKGTGIGLASVKRIIEKHNGQIWVDSELGKGSEFHFTIAKTFNH